MDIKDRIASYEPLFNRWLFDELMEIHDQEALIKLKPLGLNNNEEAFCKVITIYHQDENIEELEKRIEQIKANLGLDQLEQTEFLDYEQYLIEDNQGMIIGIDLCLLMIENDFKKINLTSLSGNLLYEIGLKLFDPPSI